MSREARAFLALSGIAAFLSSSEVAQAQLLSPGPLARGHSSLEGDASCNRCHASGRRVEDSLCLGCHTAIAASRRAGTGLHGVGYAGRPCAGCHVDHRGAGARLIRWPGGSPAALDHALTGWPLQGAHAAARCEGCHSVQRWMGTPKACGSCHEDPHERRFGASCTNCHTARAWREVRLTSFDHRQARFPLEGRHQTVACASCHGAAPRYRGIPFASCASCHADPHGGRLPGACASCHTTAGWQDVTAVRRNHPGLSLGGGHSGVACRGCHDRGNDQPPGRGAACVACHAPVHEADFGRNCASCHRGIRWEGLPRSVGLAAHPRTPFALRGVHAETACDACHDPEKPARARFRQLAFGRCTDCHEDRHEGEFARRDRGNCTPCHDERGFSPAAFGIALHATTSFPLQGKHEAVACGGCHGNERPRLSLRVEDAKCADCHDNPHGTQFAAEMRDGGCQHCHGTRGWDQPNIDHSSWPLTGVHATTACAACHAPTEQDRRSGSGASYRGVPRACEGCHEDEHAGQFRLGEPVRACTDCHDTASFEISRFDHERLARYPLQGRHERLECGACHSEVELRDEGRAVRYRLGYQACADCHRSPHTRGQR